MITLILRDLACIVNAILLCTFCVCVCVCVCVILQFFYLFCSLFLSSKWHCFRQAYKFNDGQPASKPVAVLVTTTPTHLPDTSRHLIGDTVGHSTSYEFNSLTYLLRPLPYLYLSWRFITLSRTWNFQLYEMRILIYIHICRNRPPFIVPYMSCYLVNWNKVWHRWVSTVCRSIRFGFTPCWLLLFVHFLVFYKLQSGRWLPKTMSIVHSSKILLRTCENTRCCNPEV